MTLRRATQRRERQRQVRQRQVRQRRRLLVAVASALVVVLSCACGSARYGRRLQLPPEQRLYVAVFVDETEEGRVGVPLADAVRVEVYRRDPARLAMTFDEGAWVLDGTVTAVEEAPADDDRMRLTVQAKARLLDKAGTTVARLGAVDSTTTYRISRTRAETEARRRDAIDTALEGLARELVRRVERASAAAPERETESMSSGEAA